MPYHTVAPAKSRILEYPFSHAVPLAMVSSALNSTLFFHGLGWITGAILLIFSLFGAITVLTGLQWRGNAGAGYIIERTGQYMCSGAWLTNFYVLWTLGSSPLGFFTSAALLIATVARIFNLNRKVDMVNSAQRERIREARECTD